MVGGHPHHGLGVIGAVRVLQADCITAFIESPGGAPAHMNFDIRADSRCISGVVVRGLMIYDIHVRGNSVRAIFGGGIANARTGLAEKVKSCDAELERAKSNLAAVRYQLDMALEDQAELRSGVSSNESEKRAT